MRKYFAGFAIAGFALVLAGCQTASNPSGYKFELMGQSTMTNAGTRVSIRLVRPDESPVAGAQLYVQHWQVFGAKAAPPQSRLIALERNAEGNFTYTSDDLHMGDKLHVAARPEPNSSLIYGSVEVH